MTQTTLEVLVAPIKDPAADRYVYPLLRATGSLADRFTTNP